MNFMEEINKETQAMLKQITIRKAEQTKGFRNKSITPYVYRRRVCLSCGHRFTTREYTIPDLIAFGKQGYLEMIEDLEKNI